MMNRNLIEFLKIPESVRIPYFGGKWYRFLEKLDNQSIQSESLPDLPLNTKPRQEAVIASLTSYPARIAFVHLAVKSLMVQTYKPDRIVLWLAEEQFPDKKLPKELTALESHGLEIEWMKDIYGHKKYLNLVSNQQSHEVIITFDDDIIYPKRAIERLMKMHRKFPNCLVVERGQSYDSKVEDNPGRWPVRSQVGVAKPSYSINPSPGGGCLIPYGAFHADACDEEKIRRLAYKNDDLWYMFMCANNQTKTVKTRKNHKTFSMIIGSQVEQMATNNVVNNGNAIIMEKLKSTYPEAWKRIATDAD